MLNGKFYTGLPPKMIERGSGGGRNRLESHLFWPDDTKTETAAESRIKRRNSVQLASAERPSYEKKQNSIGDDVDTRQRFSKEFSQSSIQFYDNLNDNNRQARRNSMSHRKMDIAEKPTNTKLELPDDSVVNEAYTAAKKKQAYTSKIEFYDYANDNEERNNLRRPKMDMNDKRDMELNSKNSPKLQLKRDVRSLSEEKDHTKINNSEMSNKMDDNKERRARILNNQENYLRNRRSMEPRMNVSPKRSWAKTSNKRYTDERDIYREPESLAYDRRYAKPEERYNSGYDWQQNSRYSAGGYNDNFEDERLTRDQTKRVTKNNERDYYEETAERYYNQQRPYEDEEIRNRMRNISVNTTKQPQKPCYAGEQYYDDASSYCGQNYEVETPTNRTNSYTRHDYNERQEMPYMSYNNSTDRFVSNKPYVRKINNQFQRETVASPTSPTPSSDAESTVSASRTQRHLRSSLCFNNGEIIGENDGSASPTSSHNPTPRRNARSSATQRVSVGLPD